MAVFRRGNNEALLKALEDSPARRDAFDAFENQLRFFRLVNWSEPLARYTLLPPIRACALTLWPSEAERDACILRAAQALLPIAQSYDLMKLHQVQALDVEWIN